jgi:hypothetical protein
LKNTNAEEETKRMFEVKWMEITKIDGKRKWGRGEINKKGKNSKYGSMFQRVDACIYA